MSCVNSDPYQNKKKIENSRPLTRHAFHQFNSARHQIDQSDREFAYLWITLIKVLETLHIHFNSEG